MNAAPERHAPAPDIGPATVVAPSGNQALVRFEDGETASVALAVGGYRARTGDRLLVARGRSGAWAFAVLSALREAPVRADDGTRAQLEEGALTVRDGEGRLLFSHRPDDGVSVVHAPYGDLRLSAPDGNIELDAGRDVKVSSRRNLELSAKRVRVGTTPASRPRKTEAQWAGTKPSENALTFDRTGARLETSSLTLSAAVARLAMLETTFAAHHVSTAVATVRGAFGLVETKATRVIERAKDTYREVEGLAQTRAGRIRQRAETTVHVVAERAVIKAEDEVAIKGEKIHLA
ncbi:MAG: DUF3540 domain-containing protein [Sandaracinaceae bacterium]